MADTHHDFASVVLTLRPQRAALLPLGLGRAAQAALLNWVRELDPTLAQTLHDDQTVKPYTCSTLWGGHGVSGGQIEVEPARTYRLRFTTLTPQLTALMLTSLSSLHRLELDYCPFTVEGWTVDPRQETWAGCGEYQALAAPHLLGQNSPSRYVELEFASPTTFRSGGRNMPGPLPDLVFGSLVDKWNTLSPVAVGAEVRRYAAECMAVAAYDLHSRAWPFKDALIVGGVGHCRYVMTVQDRYWMSVIQMLAEWAIFAGVGAQTASGLGQARRPPRGSSSRAERENGPSPEVGRGQGVRAKAEKRGDE
jgi:CRISPR-associated endoribonuclease Cas6